MFRLTMPVALLAIVAVGAALPGPGWAQDAAAASAARPHRLRDKFDAANVTHDGRLTEAQAEAGMPMVARNFAAIDADHKGYVTLDDVRQFVRARRAARHAMPGAAATPGAPPAPGPAQ